MKSILETYIFPFFISSIVFIATMLEANSISEQGEWSPKLYGHFFPILQDGAHSLSMKMDFWKFILDLSLFYFVFFGLFKWLKPKFNKPIFILTAIVFILITSFFIVVITIDFSFANIEYSFDYSTIKSMWN